MKALHRPRQPINFRNEMLRLGVPDFNIPVWTPDPTGSTQRDHRGLKAFAETKGVVLAKSATGKVAIIRFGNWDHPSGHDPKMARDFYQRHRRAIARGKLDPKYWEWYYLWADGCSPWIPGQSRHTGRMARGTN